MGAGPVRLPDMLAALDLLGIDDREARTDVVVMWSRMDDELLKYLAEKQKTKT